MHTGNMVTLVVVLKLHLVGWKSRRCSWIPKSQWGRLSCENDNSWCGIDEAVLKMRCVGVVHVVRLLQMIRVVL